MKFLSLSLLLCLSFAGTCFAGNSFLDFLNPPDTNTASMQQETVCPNCGQGNVPGSAYCSGCGAVLLPANNAAYARCPHCGKNNVITVKHCSACGAENPIQSNYCFQCGSSLSSSVYRIVCKYCGDTFKFTPSYAQDIKCPHCHKYYSSRYDECPYCAEERNSLREDKNRHGKQDKHEQENKQTRHDDQGYNKSSGNAVLVDEFTETNSGQQGKKYNIAGHTSRRAYSKVIINCHILSGGMSVNTIYVRTAGHDATFPVTARLKEGRNEFNVSIPRGSEILIVSFQSSGNIEVKVYLQ
jgi:hypothetical protein